MKSLKKASVCALFLVFMAANWVQAEVKLRIYLRDGTLQAGNLVTITENDFVILGKAGRMTVPKNQIMFINGKTLKQWENQPDKYFQTEIIPSSIPDPNYVNAQATLPPPPPVQPLAPLSPPKKEIQATATRPPLENSAPKTAAASVPPSAGVVSTPVVIQPSAAPGTAGRSTVMPLSSPSHHADLKPEAAAQPATPAVKVASKKSMPKKSAKPGTLISDQPRPEPLNAQTPPKFSRDTYAQIHFERGQAYLSQGALGQAMQEFHYACVLDRRNAGAAVLLSRLYMDDGVFTKARHILEHPGLKKSKDKADLLQEMTQKEKSQKQNQWILYGGTAGGILAVFPLLALVRRFRRPSKREIFLDAETLKDSQYVKATSMAPPVQETYIEDGLREEAEIPMPVSESLDKAEFPFALHDPELALPPQVSLSQSEPLAQIPKEAPPAPDKKTEIPPVEKRPAEDPLRMFRDQIAPPPEQKPVERPPVMGDKTKETPFALPPASTPLKEMEPALSAAAPQPSHPASQEQHGLEERELFLKNAAKAESAIQEGNRLAHAQKFDLARRQYRTALALNPSCYEAYIGLGFVSFMQGQWELALDLYTKARALNPNRADAYYGRGRVLLEESRVEEAVPELQKTLDLDPTFDDARETLTLLGRAS